MRVKIPKSQLLRQLPDDIRRDLVSCNDLPDMFVFDIMSPDKDGQDEFELKELRLHKDFQHVSKIFTGMQWYMFAMLAKHFPEPVSITVLSRKLRGNGRSSEGNGVAVHIKEMRRKLGESGMPFEIENIRGSVISKGGYRLIKK